jgi:hypothetical protein
LPKTPFQGTTEPTCPRWRLFGQATEFDAIQGPKPYRKAYPENVKKFLEKVNVEWNTPILEWGTNLTGLSELIALVVKLRHQQTVGGRPQAE